MADQDNTVQSAFGTVTSTTTAVMTALDNVVSGNEDAVSAIRSTVQASSSNSNSTKAKATKGNSNKASTTKSRPSTAMSGKGGGGR